IPDARNDEDAAPPGGRCTDQATQWYDERRDTLGDVQQAGISRCETPPIRVAADRREEAIDLAVREEDERREQHEPHRICAEAAEQEDRRALECERDEHRLLATELIGHPTEERPTDPIQDAIHRQSKRQREQ